MIKFMMIDKLKKNCINILCTRRSSILKKLVFFTDDNNNKKSDKQNKIALSVCKNQFLDFLSPLNVCTIKILTATKKEIANMPVFISTNLLSSVFKFVSPD